MKTFIMMCLVGFVGLALAGEADKEANPNTAPNPYSKYIYIYCKKIIC